MSGRRPSGAPAPPAHGEPDAALPAPRLHLESPLAQVDVDYFRSTRLLVRVAVLLLLAGGAFAVLVFRLWSLEVLHGAQFARRARIEATRVVIEPGPRGPILDARGRTLAADEGRDVVEALPDLLGAVGEDGTWHPTGRGQRVLDRLGRLAGRPSGLLVARIRAGLVSSPEATPVVLRHPGRRLAFYLLERSGALPGVRVSSEPVRRYPQGGLGSEFLGLVGQLDALEVHEGRYRRDLPGELVGQSGVEETYEPLLQGGLHGTRVLVDAFGRRVSSVPLRGSAPHGIRLTIDARLQRAAERAVRHGIDLAHAAGHSDARAGAAVVLDPRTGAVEALASLPAVNEAAAARSPSYVARLLGRGDAPLLDRAIQGLYPAGSTFKPIVAEAGIATGTLGRSARLACTGSLTVGDRVFHNVEAGIDAELTLPRALEISCDTWFYRLGLELYAHAREAPVRWAGRFGFGRPTGIDLPGESYGQVPVPRYAGDAVNLSIGQGALLVTPLQLAVAYAALANGGRIVRPHVAGAVLSADGRLDHVLRFPARRRLRLRGLPAIRAGLYLAAHDPSGTSARVFSRFPVPVVGKTGTAQAPPGSDDSWYASWAPARSPRVVVVVLIEHGGFGADAAAPAARDIYASYFHLPAGPG